MSEERNTISIFDTAIESQFKFLAHMLTVGYGNEKSRWQTAQDFDEAKERQLKNLAQLKTGRAKDDAWQAEIVQQNFNHPVFNADHWRQVAWIDRKAEIHRAPDDPSLHLRFKSGGMIQVEPQRVSFDEQSATKREAIEYAIIHAKKAWAGEAVSLNGDATFKATAWAFAQVHGVKVADYQPEGEALKLAQKIIDDRKAEDAKRPPNKPPNNDHAPRP